MRYLLAIGVLLCLCIPLARGQDKVKEPSTEREFPSTVSFSYAGKDYSLAITGVAVRKKIIIKVYGMAHYMQEPGKMTEEDAYKAILTEGKAKQISLVFVRDVDAESIQNAYRDGFKNSVSESDYAKIKGTVDKFLAYFSSPAKENDSFTYRWLPGGIVVVIAQGQEKPALTDPLFARALWTIWFGEDSIVDREDLVERMLK
jgi:hypothetical protein